MTLARSSWLLLLLALRDATEPLDPVRLQSGMFLLSRHDGVPAAQTYDFDAADSGPFASAIDHDIADLEERGLVFRDQVAGYTWSEFIATRQGLVHAQDLVSGMDEGQLDTLRHLAAVKTDVLSLSFRDLLDRLLREYPAFARNSVFR
jgi:hypothetical protein